MAEHVAIAAVGEAICALLTAALRGAGHATVPATLAGSADLARGYTSSAITVYLYRVGLDASTRNLVPQRQPDGAARRPPLSVELHYLVTAWAADVAEQHRLLGLALRAMNDGALLPPATLNAVTASGSVFGSHESVMLVAAPVSQADMVAIWEPAKASMQPSMPYVARVVYLDSDRALVEGPPVTTRILRVEQP